MIVCMKIDSDAEGDNGGHKQNGNVSDKLL